MMAFYACLSLVVFVSIAYLPKFLVFWHLKVTLDVRCRPTSVIYQNNQICTLEK